MSSELTTDQSIFCYHKTLDKALHCGVSTPGHFNINFQGDRRRETAGTPPADDPASVCLVMLSAHTATWWPAVCQRTDNYYCLLFASWRRSKVERPSIRLSTLSLRVTAGGGLHLPLSSPQQLAASGGFFFFFFFYSSEAGKSCVLSCIKVCLCAYEFETHTQTDWQTDRLHFKMWRWQKRTTDVYTIVV